MKLNRLFIIQPIIYIILYGCANMVPPNGGPKDDMPPGVISINPPNETIHFNSKEIVITFNEYVRIQDAYNQVIISPPLDKMPSYKIKGKNLIIGIEESLRDSSTYTINFGSSLKDITESNPLSNFNYVFSTGGFIDSLKIKGQILDAYSLQPVEDILFMLYSNKEDSVVFKEKPYYFSKTDDKGRFNINNIKSGRYKAFALADKNFNYLYDLPNEMIGFDTTYINIDSNILNYSLKSFEEKDSTVKFLNSKGLGFSQALFIFNRKTSLSSIKSLQDTIGFSEFYDLSKDQDSIYYWTKNSLLDTLSFKIILQDSSFIRNVSVKSISPDTIQLLYNFSFTSNGVRTLASKKSATQKGTSVITNWDLGTPISITSQYPIRNLDSRKISIIEDSTLISDEFEVERDTNSIRKLTIQYNWKEKRTYKVLILPGAIVDIFGLTNDTIESIITLRAKNDYGKINITLKNTPPCGLIVQLINSSDKVVRTEIPNKETNQINFTNILTGKYSMRAIYDCNFNGIWDPGSYSVKKQSEFIELYPETINLRPNWELEEEWTLLGR